MSDTFQSDVEANSLRNPAVYASHPLATASASQSLADFHSVTTAGRARSDVIAKFRVPTAKHRTSNAEPQKELQRGGSVSQCLEDSKLAAERHSSPEAPQPHSTQPSPRSDHRSNSDREIESVNGRLASLERMLETFVGNQINSQSSNASPPASSGAPALSTPRDSQLPWRELDFEGDSSFSAHSRSITQVIEKGLKSAPDADTIGDVTAAVATLRSFLNEKPTPLNTSASLQSTLRDVVHYPELSSLTLPPMQSVLNLLRYAKSMSSPPISLLQMSPAVFID